MKVIATVLSVAVLFVIVILLLRSRHAALSSSTSSLPANGRLRIRDLTIDDIRSGQNWRLTDPDEFLQIGKKFHLEDVHIAKTETFTEKDHIAYSTVFVTEAGDVSPLVLIKEVGDSEPGGDYCEIHGGKWRQLGLVPNPRAPNGRGYVANPLDQDPSFNTMDNKKDDLRAELRDGFKKWSDKLKGAQPGGTGD